MISFVVPAYNEEKYLGPTLASIHEAARAVGELYEIVVANDDSSDATAQVAEAGGARVITIHKRQIAGTRNAGAAAAKGDWLVFVDADTQVNADVVRGTVEAFRGGAVAGGALGANVDRIRDPQSGQDVRRCETVAGQTPQYWDVTYNFQGVQHHVQMTTQPGPTIAVNNEGEPRL